MLQSVVVASFIEQRSSTIVNVALVSDKFGNQSQYFDEQDRVVLPTAERTIWVVAETAGPAHPRFDRKKVYDLTTTPIADPQLGIIDTWYVTARRAEHTISSLGIQRILRKMRDNDNNGVKIRTAREGNVSAPNVAPGRRWNFVGFTYRGLHPIKFEWRHASKHVLGLR